MSSVHQCALCVCTVEGPGVRCPSEHVPAWDNGRGYEKSDFTTCLPITWRHGNPIFSSIQAVLRVLKFNFLVFCTGCRIGQDSLAGLKPVVGMRVDRVSHSSGLQSSHCQANTGPSISLLSCFKIVVTPTTIFYNKLWLLFIFFHHTRGVMRR